MIKTNLCHLDPSGHSCRCRNCNTGLIGAVIEGSGDQASVPVEEKSVCLSVLAEICPVSSVILTDWTFAPFEQVI